MPCDISQYIYIITRRCDKTIRFLILEKIDGICLRVTVTLKVFVCTFPVDLMPRLTNRTTRTHASSRHRHRCHLTLPRFSIECSSFMFINASLQAQRVNSCSLVYWHKGL